MKRIIEHGRPKIIIRRFTCSVCGCVFEADENDSKFCFDRNETWYYSSCPDCGKAAYSVYQGG